MANGGETVRVQAVSGVQLAQGVGVQEARGFWADAWSQVARRAGARAAMAWLSLVAFLGFFAPFIANGHPLILRTTGPDGVSEVISPLLRNLSSTDVALALGALISVPWVLLGRHKGSRVPVSKRLAMVLLGVGMGAAAIVAVGL